jgi:predicted lipid-binding transport protein (Tim44 family)
MNQKRSFFVWLSAIFVLCSVYLLVEAADAARLGGGRSFGSRPSYQRSAPAPSAPSGGINQPYRQNPTATPSPMGRWGGMLGGLVMGSLIGSLLFGGGMHGLGSFGLLDLLVVGGGLFLLFRFMRSRRALTESAAPGAGFQRSYDDRGWGSSGYNPAADAMPAASPEPTVPPGFDTDEFMKGAKIIYTRLQSAWDKRDLKDIREFTSPEVYEEIKSQAAKDPHPGKTELLLVNPRLLEARNQDGHTIASVFYDVMMREGADETAKQVREIWHFSREDQKPGAFWVLEGIQQVES